MSKFLLVLILILTSSVCSLGQQMSPRREGGDPAQRPLDSFTIQASDLKELFGKVSLTYSIPIGFETALTHQRTPINVEFNGKTVRDLLDQVLKTNNTYAWSSSGDVINIIPKDGHRDLVVMELLDARISRFAVQEGTSCTVLEKSLTSLPEITGILNANGIKYWAQPPNGFYLRQVGRDYEVEFSNLTLKTILNQVIKDSPKVRFWSLGRRHEEPAVLSFYFGATF